nr:MAG TPA: Protein transport protein SEC31 [Crassvirales sp.]
MYKAKGKDEFLRIIKPLFISSRQEDNDWNDLPFRID